MKTFHIVLILLFYVSLNNIQAQIIEKVEPTIGAGLLQVSLNHDIPLYKNSKARQPFDTLKFSVVSEQKDKGKFKIYTTNQHILKPYLFFEGDSEEEAIGNISMGLVYFAPALTFRVLEYIQTEKYSGYTIVLNEDTFEKAFIRNDEFHELYMKGEPYWEMSHNSGSRGGIWYLYETWDVYLKRLYYAIVEKDTQIYREPDDTFFLLQEEQSFNIQEVKGEWVKITRIDDEVELNGWIKWTDGLKLLIKPITAVYY